MQVGLLLGGDRPVNGGENAAQRGQVDVVVHAYAEDVLPLCVPELDIGHGHGVGAGLNGVLLVIHEGEAVHFLAVNGVEEGVDGAVALAADLKDGLFVP